MFSKSSSAGRALWPLAIALVVILSFSASAQNIPVSQHVVLVIDENHSFSQVFPSGMPWLVGEGNANGYATNYHSDSNGSLMNYLWLASGSCHADANTCTPSTLPSNTTDFHCNGNDCPSPITDNNIFRVMNNLGITWKVYTELYNAVGATPTAPDQVVNGLHYYRRHNGATWYSDILSGGLASHIVDFSQLVLTSPTTICRASLLSFPMAKTTHMMAP
ncbi:MAG TPA: alkaline phosphatase family protein [Candidatus Angelobacter sp.]